MALSSNCCPIATSLPYRDSIGLFWHHYPTPDVIVLSNNCSPIATPLPYRDITGLWWHHYPTPDVIVLSNNCSPIATSLDGTIVFAVYRHHSSIDTTALPRHHCPTWCLVTCTHANWSIVLLSDNYKSQEKAKTLAAEKRGQIKTRRRRGRGSNNRLGILNRGQSGPGRGGCSNLWSGLAIHTLQQKLGQLSPRRSERHTVISTPSLCP